MYHVPRKPRKNRKHEKSIPGCEREHWHTIRIDFVIPQVNFKKFLCDNCKTFVIFKFQSKNKYLDFKSFQLQN